MKLTRQQLGAACLFVACVWAMFNSLESISPVVDNMPVQGSGIYVSIGSYQWMGRWRSYREEKKELLSIIDQLKGSTASYSERKTTRETSHIIGMWIEITWAKAVVAIWLSVSLLFSSQINWPQVSPKKREEPKKWDEPKKWEEPKKCEEPKAPSETQAQDIAKKGKRIGFKKGKRIRIEKLEQHYGYTRAAGRLGVSVSTLKRKCREYGIDRLPTRAEGWGLIRQCFDGPINLSTKNDSIAETSETPTICDSGVGNCSNMDFSTPYISKESEEVTGSCERIVQVEDQSAMSIVYRNSNPFVSVQPLVALTQMASENLGSSDDQRTSLSLQAQQHMWFVMIKAIHGTTNLRFLFPVASGIIGLKEEVSKRLKFEVDSFDVKYVDDAGDLIFIACDEDLMFYLNVVFRPLRNRVFILYVIAKTPN